MVRENGEKSHYHNRMGNIIFMKVIMYMIERMVLEYLNGIVVINFKDSTLMMREMDMVRCSGQMEVFIKDCGRMVFNMEWE